MKKKLCKWLRSLIKNNLAAWRPAVALTLNRRCRRGTPRGYQKTENRGQKTEHCAAAPQILYKNIVAQRHNYLSSVF